MGLEAGAAVAVMAKWQWKEAAIVARRRPSHPPARYSESGWRDGCAAWNAGNAMHSALMRSIFG
jgi:hypothetical protein